MTPRHRADTTQAKIVTELRQIPGVFVWLTGGAIDAVVGYRGRTFLVDFKSRYTPMTSFQQKMLDEWNGGPLLFARTTDEVLELMEIEP